MLIVVSGIKETSGASKASFECLPKLCAPVLQGQATHVLRLSGYLDVAQDDASHCKSMSRRLRATPSPR
jgi:hypothetical protein